MDLCDSTVCLLAVELLCIAEVSKVLMVHEDLELLCCTLEEMAPLIQCMHDGHHFLIMDLIIVLYENPLDMKATGWCVPSAWAWERTAPVVKLEASHLRQK